MRRAHTGQTAGHDLAGFGDESRKQAHVLVVDAVNFLGAELANLLAAEEFPAAFAGTAWAAARPSSRTWSAGWTALAALRAVGTRTGVRGGGANFRCRC